MLPFLVDTAPRLGGLDFMVHTITWRALFAALLTISLSAPLVFPASGEAKHAEFSAKLLDSGSPMQVRALYRRIADDKSRSRMGWLARAPMPRRLVPRVRGQAVVIHGVLIPSISGAVAHPQFPIPPPDFSPI